MNRIYSRQSITLALLVSLALVAFFGWYSYVNMKKAREETQQVNKSLQTLKILENLLDDVQDIETANRGFLISGNREFLEPYTVAISNLAADSTNILNLADGASERRDTLRWLIRLTNKKLDIARKTEDLVARGRETDALELVKTGAGKALMDTIRDVVWQLETADRKVLNSSNRSREVAATNMARLFVLLSISFIFLASLFFYMVYLDLKRRDSYEKRIAYLAGLTELTSDGIISCNKDLRVVSWNKGAENIYGFTAAEAIGQPIGRLVKSSALEKGEDLLRKEVMQKGFTEFESTDITKDGRSIYCQISTTMLKDGKGVFTGFVSVIRDATQRKLAEKLIYEFNHELAEKVREKTADLRNQEEKLRHVLDSSAGEFYVIDRDYRILLISREAEKKLEKFWGERIRSGESIMPHLPDASRENILRNYQKAFDGEEVEYETAVVYQGVANWINVSYRPVRNSGGEITGAFIGTRDITARKQAEARLQESESRYRTLVEQATEIIVLVDPRGQFVQVNEAGIRILGYTREEVLNMTLFDIVVIGPGDPPLRFDVLRSGAGMLSTRKVKRKDGSLLQLELSTKMLDNGFFIGIGRDISDRVRAQNALIESENRFRAIFNTQLQMVTLLDRSGRILETNTTALQVIGYRNEDVIGRYFWEIRLWQNEADRPERIERIRHAIELASAGEHVRYEGQISLKPGVTEDVDLSIKPIPGIDGRPLMLLMEGRLITEFKKAEKNLKESEARYRSFFEYSMDGILLSAPDGGILSANPAACAMFGMTEAEIIQAGRAGLTDPLDEKGKLFVSILNKAANFSNELNFKRKDGTIFPGEYSSGIFRDAAGAAQISLIIRDITERRRSEEAIRQSNKRFEMISRTTNDAIWEWDIRNGKKWANKTHQLLYGLKPEDPVPDEDTWRNRIHPADRKQIVSRQEFSLASDTNVFISEYRFLNGDGNYVFVFDRCYIERDAAGAPIRMTGSMMDISDRKRSEEQLMESEQRLRLSLEAGKQGLYDLNVQTGEAVVNDQYALMLGYKPETFKETNAFWIERLHPDDAAVTRKAYLEYTNGNTSEYKVEFRTKTASGSWKWILSLGKIVEYDAAGKPLRMLGTHTDIDSIKTAEAALFRSQRRFQNLVENISGVYWVNDLDARKTLYISPSYEAIWGRSCEELYADPAAFIRAVYPEDIQRLTTIYNNIIERKQESVEYRIMRPDGDIRWIYAKINVVPGEDGKHVEYGYAEDITERRRAETELIESNARFQIVSKATSDLVWDWDLLSATLWWNDNYYSSLGYTKVTDRVHENEWYDRIHPAERERVRTNVHKCFRGKSTVWRDEYRYRKEDGSYLHFLDRGYIMRNESGQAIRMIGSMVDMTTIYAVQRKIEESEMRLRTILDTDPECISLFDPEINLLEINKAGLLMLEETPVSELAGKPFLSYVEEKYRKVVERLLKDAFRGRTGSLEFGLLTAKGTHRWCEMNVVPFRNPDKKIISALAVTRDISERMQAVNALRLSEEKYRTLVEQAADAIALYDLNGRILETNTSASRLLGFSQEEMILLRLDQILLPEDVVDNPVQYDVLSAGISTVKIRRMRRKDGSIVITEVRSQQLPDGRFLSVIRDMTDRIKAEEELKASYKAVRSLTNYLQNIREQERTNIAREIHDELGQQLTVLKMDVSWLKKRVGVADEKVAGRLNDLLKMLDDTVKSVRRISSQLRPSLLDDLGLTAALEWQLSEFEKRAGVKTAFRAPQEEFPLTDAAKTALFRIFQECLTNVARHSGADTVWVELEAQETCLQMSIRDNGNGFDVAGIAEKKTLGILGMKERTEMIGGTYEIRSKPGGGTTVIICVPNSKFAV